MTPARRAPASRTTSRAAPRDPLARARRAWRLVASIVALARARRRRARRRAASSRAPSRVVARRAVARGAGCWCAALRRWFPPRLALRLAPGAGEPVPPGQPDARRGARARLRGASCSARCYLVQHNLLRELRARPAGPTRPNLVLFDIQPDQRRRRRRRGSRRAGLVPSSGTVPIVPMRIAVHQAAAAVSELLGDADRRAARRRNAGRCRREYRSTYRDSLVASEQVVGGPVVDERRRGLRSGRACAFSVEAGLARELGVDVGDEIVWDVQGVACRRAWPACATVDWARFEPNFFVVFPPGALERGAADARHADAGGRRRGARAAPAPAGRAFLQRHRARPRAGAAGDRAASSSRVALAIRFMALFSLATGALVLVGAIATSRLQRVREGGAAPDARAPRGAGAPHRVRRVPCAGAPCLDHCGCPRHRRRLGARAILLRVARFEVPLPGSP